MRIFPRKRFFQQNHFSLNVGYSFIEKTNAKTSRDTATLRRQAVTAAILLSSAACCLLVASVPCDSNLARRMCLLPHATLSRGVYPCHLPLYPVVCASAAYHFVPRCAPVPPTTLSRKVCPCLLVLRCVPLPVSPAVCAPAC